MPPCSCTVSPATTAQAVGAVRLRGVCARGQRTEQARAVGSVRGDVRRGRGRRRPRRRARHLDQHEQVGHPVLERLERADRAPELHALLAVGDRHVEAALRDADLHRGREGRRHQGEPLRRRGRHVEVTQPQRGVQRLAPRGRHRRRGQSRGARDQHHVGPGVEHERRLDDHGRRPPGRDPGQQLLAQRVRIRPAAAPRSRPTLPAGERGPASGRPPRAPPRSRRATRPRRRTPRARREPPRRPARTAPATGRRRTRRRSRPPPAPPGCPPAARAGRAASWRAPAAPRCAPSARLRARGEVLEQHRPVVRRGAPRRDQRPHREDPAAQVELARVADRAVHLQRRA